MAAPDGHFRDARFDNGQATERMACTTLVKRDFVYLAKRNAKVLCTTNATIATIAGDAVEDGMHDRREA